MTRLDPKQPTSRPREQPVDVEAAAYQGLHPGQASATGGAHVAADLDYYNNLKRFARFDDMAAEPNRNKGNESGQRPPK